MQCPPELPISVEDTVLAGRIAEAMRNTGYGVLCDIKIVTYRRTIHLSGRVPSYYLKQVAQNAVLAIAGVLHIVNELEVPQKS